MGRGALKSPLPVRPVVGTGRGLGLGATTCSEPVLSTCTAVAKAALNKRPPFTLGRSDRWKFWPPQPGPASALSPEGAGERAITANHTH
jgi:hypothetical protein